jgi:hypothetical protein
MSTYTKSPHFVSAVDSDPGLIPNSVCALVCCNVAGMFIPDPRSEFFPSRIRIFPIPDPGSATKNLSILTQEIVSKLSEIRSGLFIPDQDPDFLPIPDPGRSKRHRIPNPQHWYERSVFDVTELHGLSCDVRVPPPCHRGHLLHHARPWRSGHPTFLQYFFHFYETTAGICAKSFNTRTQSFPMS